MWSAVKSKLARINLPLWTVPLVLLALCVASYGMLANKLGFFWDDWTIVWYIHFLGPSSFPAAFSFDRPLLAPIYMLTTSLVGESPLAWQIFAIFTRWLACLALWWTLRAIWPKHVIETSSVAILFAVYPGFKQQYIAITYGNAFLVLALYLASWGMMLWSIRLTRRFWLLYLASILASLYAVFTAEHYFGLEFLRPFFLWLVLADIGQAVGVSGTTAAGQTVSSSPSRPRLKRTLLLWLPYLFIDLIFLAWRIANKTPRAQITLFSALKANPFGTVVNLAQTALQDIYKSSASAWLQTLDFNWLIDSSTSVLVKYAAIAGGIALGLAVFLIFLKHSFAASTSLTGSARRRWGWQATGLGLFALLLGGIPIWPTNLRIELFFPWDRFTLPMMLGASLLLVGLFELVGWRAWVSILLVALAAGLGAGLHFQNALEFRKDWLMQRDFFWQLAWRAPQIKPGTVLLTSDLPFPYDWDNSLIAPLNWTYAPQLQGRELPYLIYNAESRLSSGLPDLQKDSQITEDLRITPFKGSLSQTVLAFYQPPGSCVKVIDPLNDKNLPDKPRYFKDIYSFSDPGLIEPGTADAQPPLQFFGPEPSHNWCYWFEKAELARQLHDWTGLAALGDRALKSDKGFFKKNVAELMPYIEGYARVGRWDRAYQLTMQAYKAWENTHIMLCNTWENMRLDGALDAQGQATYTRIFENLQCQALLNP
jgi:hypothetical protein